MKYPEEFEDFWKGSYGQAPHAGASKKEAGYTVYRRMLTKMEQLELKLEVAQKALKEIERIEGFQCTE